MPYFLEKPLGEGNLSHYHWPERRVQPVRTVLWIKIGLRCPYPPNATAPRKSRFAEKERTAVKNFGYRFDYTAVDAQTLYRSWLLARLLLYPQNRVLCRLGDSEF